MKIAVCDDDKKIREQISSLIKRQAPDSDTCQYTSGEDMISAGIDHDICFLDIAMGNVSGIELAKRIRKRQEKSGKRSIIIFITGFREYMEDAFDVNAFHYLVKPIKEDKFKEVFKRAENGYPDSDISDALLMMSTCIPPKSPIHGKSFSLTGDQNLGNLLMSLRYDKSIPSYNTCLKNYKKWDDKSAMCEICPFSKRNKNVHIDAEQKVVQYCFASEDNYNYVVSKGVTPDHFAAFIDVLQSFPGKKPCLFDLYKVCFPRDLM